MDKYSEWLEKEHLNWGVNYSYSPINDWLLDGIDHSIEIAFQSIIETNFPEYMEVKKKPVILIYG